MNPLAINEIVHLLQIILNQNYFHFNNTYFIQKEDLPNGSLF